MADIDEYLAIEPQAAAAGDETALEVDSGGDMRLSAAVTIVACMVLVASLWLDWIVGQGVAQYHARGVDQLFLDLLVGCVVIAILALSFIDRRAQADTREPWGAVPAAIVVVFCLVLIALVEGVLAALPTDGLPDTFQRAGAGASAGPGAWLALISSAGLLAIALARNDAGLQSAGQQMKKLGTAAPAVAILGISGMALARIRYEPILTLAAEGDEVVLAYWWMPLIGPLSLLAAWGLGVAAVLGVFRRFSAAGLLGVVCGWVALMVMIWGYVITEMAAKADHINWVLPEQIREQLHDVTPVADRIAGGSLQVEVDRHFTSLALLFVSLMAIVASLLLTNRR